MTVAVGGPVTVYPECAIYECENVAPRFAKYLTVDGVPIRVPLCNNHRNAWDHRSAIHDSLDAKVGVKADTREKWEAARVEHPEGQ